MSSRAETINTEFAEGRKRVSRHLLNADLPPVVAEAQSEPDETRGRGTALMRFANHCGGRSGRPQLQALVCAVACGQTQMDGRTCQTGFVIEVALNWPPWAANNLAASRPDLFLLMDRSVRAPSYSLAPAALGLTVLGWERARGEAPRGPQPDLGQDSCRVRVPEIGPRVMQMECCVSNVRFIEATCGRRAAGFASESPFLEWCAATVHWLRLGAADCALEKGSLVLSTQITSEAWPVLLLRNPCVMVGAGVATVVAGAFEMTMPVANVAISYSTYNTVVLLRGAEGALRAIVATDSLQVFCADKVADTACILLGAKGKQKSTPDSAGDALMECSKLLFHMAAANADSAAAAVYSAATALAVRAEARYRATSSALVERPRPAGASAPGEVVPGISASGRPSD